MNVEIDEIEAFLEGQEHVSVAYPFGSYAKGKTGPLSDVDIAVLLDRQLDKQEAFNLRLRLINACPPF